MLMVCFVIIFSFKKNQIELNKKFPNIDCGASFYPLDAKDPSAKTL